MASTTRSVIYNEVLVNRADDDIGFRDGVMHLYTLWVYLYLLGRSKYTSSRRSGIDTIRSNIVLKEISIGRGGAGAKSRITSTMRGKLSSFHIAHHNPSVRRISFVPFRSVPFMRSCRLHLESLEEESMLMVLPPVIHVRSASTCYSNSPPLSRTPGRSLTLILSTDTTTPRYHIDRVSYLIHSGHSLLPM